MHLRRAFCVAFVCHFCQVCCLSLLRLRLRFFSCVSSLACLLACCSLRALSAARVCALFLSLRNFRFLRLLCCQRNSMQFSAEQFNSSLRCLAVFASFGNCLFVSSFRLLRIFCLFAALDKLATTQQSNASAERQTLRVSLFLHANINLTRQQKAANLVNCRPKSKDATQTDAKTKQQKQLFLLSSFESRFEC